MDNTKLMSYREYFVAFKILTLLELYILEYSCHIQKHKHNLIKKKYRSSGTIHETSITASA